jgi:hypothetical protein
MQMRSVPYYWGRVVHLVGVAAGGSVVVRAVVVDAAVPGEEGS